MKLKSQIFTLLLLLYPVITIQGLFSTKEETQKQELSAQSLKILELHLIEAEKTLQELSTPQENLNRDLARAIDKNDYKAVQNAISKGADIHAEYLFCNMFDKALHNNFLDIAKLLIENDIDINKKDTLGHTPLIQVAACGRIHLVKFLLDNGADSSIIVDGKTAFDFAKENCHHSVANFIKEYESRKHKELEESTTLEKPD